MKTQIYFVRHGEVHNPKKIIYGRLPHFHLTEKGRIQVKKTAEYLSKFKISMIYTSPLLRARQTAAIINNYTKTKNIRLSKKLLEIRSHLDGEPNSFFETGEANFYANDIRQADDETIEDILHRMQTFSKHVAKVHKGENIVAVSHGDPLMILKAHVLSGNVTITSIRPSYDLYINHAEVYKIEINGESIASLTPIFNPKFN